MLLCDVLTLAGLLEKECSVDAWLQSWTDPLLNLRAKNDLLLPVLPCLKNVL